MKEMTTLGHMVTHKVNTPPENKSHEEWSEEDERKLLELYRKNYGLNGIARLIGRSPSAIRKRLSLIRNKNK